ncbi:YadA-like family protein [Actinobacillus genomosp. 2]|uniref:YadA-like family protein n=1 Tax=Actinobacillus genomosp. 2 TaxID=230709 RepID=UPI002441395A|nr:YadA-like family protein [Actinobacillus genomosp. 2]WGE31418.1 YadA-like family protein [Actinobacillus genomosp. 2]
MNKIFKVIWDHSSQTWVAVSELSKAKGKTKSTAKAIVVALSTLGAVDALAATAYQGTTQAGSAVATAADATAIGDTASAASYAVAVGSNAKANTNVGIAIGEKAQTNPIDNLGYKGNKVDPVLATDSNKLIAIGQNTNVVGKNSIGIGAGTVMGINNIVIGASGISNPDWRTYEKADGTTVQRPKTDHVIIGNGVSVMSGMGSVAVGHQSVVGGGDYVTSKGNTLYGTSADAFATAIGTKTQAYAFGVSLGAGATSDQIRSNGDHWLTGTVAIGAYAYTDNAAGGNAIGSNAFVKGQASNVIGVSARAGAGSDFSNAIGYNASARSASGIALGNNAIAGQYSAQSIIDAGRTVLNQGEPSTIANQGAITQVAPGATAIGSQANALSDHTIALGTNSAAGGTAKADVAVLEKYRDALTAQVTAATNKRKTAQEAYVANPSVATLYDYNLADRTLVNLQMTLQDVQSDLAKVLPDNVVSSDSAIAIGAATVARNHFALALGAAAKSTGNSSTAIGRNANVTGNYSTAVGFGNVVRGDNSGAFGDPSVVDGSNSTVLGNNHVIAKNTEKAISIGNQNSLGGTGTRNADGVVDQTKELTLADSASGSMVIGNNNTVNAENVMVLGNNITVAKEKAGSVILGQDAKTEGSHAIENVTSATIGTGAAQVTYDGFKGTVKDEGRFVSVGAKGDERKIINLAAGNISATSTEAINGSQLYAVIDKAHETQTHYYSVNDSGNHRDNYKNDGATGDAALAAGVNASATADNAIAIGNATAERVSSIAIGDGANATGINAAGNQGGANGAMDSQHSIAIGTNAKAVSGGVEDAQAATAIGLNSVSYGPGTIAIGQGATADNNAHSVQYATAIGVNANASNDNTVAIGKSAAASGNEATALGLGSEAKQTATTAVGSKAKALADQATAVGFDSYAAAQGTVALGQSASAERTGAFAGGMSSNAGGERSVAVGSSANAGGTYSVAIGNSSTSATSSSIALGNGAKNIYKPNDPDAEKNQLGSNAVAIGLNAETSELDTIAIGNRSTASGNIATAIGSQAKAEGTASLAVGDRVEAKANFATVLGSFSKAENIYDIAIGSEATANGANGGHALAMGYKSEATGFASISEGIYSNASGRQSVSLGYAASSTENNAMALGQNATASLQNSVALGSFATTSADATAQSAGLTAVTSANVNGVEYGTFAATTPKAVVSVGKAGDERRIQNVAAGLISATSTDAINGSQLYAVIDNSGWNATSGTANGGVQVGTATQAKVKNGEEVKFIAGKNLSVEQVDQNFTFATVDNPEFTSVKVGDTNNPITIETKDGNNQITGLTSTLPDTDNTTTNQAAPQDVDNTKAATLGDVLNAGWNLQEKGAAKDFVKPYDTVNFIDGTGTKVNITTDGSVSNVKFDIDTAALTTPITNNQAGNVNNVNQGDENKLATAGDVVNAVNNAFWTVHQNGDAATNQVKASNEVHFVDSDTLTATVSKDGDTKTNVTFTAKTSDITVEGDVNNADAGKATAVNPNQLATAGDIAEAINNAGFKLKTSATDGEKDAASTGDELINPSDVVEMVAGKNLKVKQEANGKVTYSTTDDVEFNNVTANNVTSNKIEVPNTDPNSNKPNITIENNSITGLDSSLPTASKFDNGVAGSEAPKSQDAPTNVNTGKAATLGDVLNAGWNLKENGTEKDFVTPYETVDFVNGNGTTVNITTKDGVSKVKVDIDVKALTGNITNNPDGTANGGDVNNGGKLTTVNEVKDAINKSGWKVTADKDGTGTVSGKTEELINPSELVTFRAGDNMVLNQAGNVFTYSVNPNPVFTTVTAKDGVTIGNNTDTSPNVTMTTQEGSPTNVGKPDGTTGGDTITPSAVKFGDKDGNPVQLTGVSSPLTTKVTPTTDANGTNPADVQLVDLSNLTLAQQNSAVTAGDLANMGWVVSAPENQYKQAVKNANEVKFTGENGISVTGKTDENGVYNVTVKADTAKVGVNNDGTATNVDKDGNPVTTPINPNALATAADVINTVNNTFWNVAGNGDVKDGVKAGDTVNFKDGAGTKVVINSDGKTTDVQFNIDVNALTGDITNNANGTANGGDTANGGKLTTVNDVKDAINNSGWTATAGQGVDGGEVSGKSNELVNPGETVTFDAGKNMKLVQENGKFTYATKDDVTFNQMNATTVVVGDPKDPAKSTTLTSGDNGLDVGGDKISNVADGDISPNSNQAVNGDQLYNYVNVNGKPATNKDGKVNFVNGSNTNVSVDPNTGDIAYNVNNTTLNVADAGNVNVPTGEEANKFVNAGDLANTLNNVAWNVEAKAVEGTTGKSEYQGGDKVKAGDKVSINAGNNIVVSGKGKNINIATSKTPEFTSVQVGKNTVISEGKDVDGNTSVNVANKDGSPTRITNVKAGKARTDAVNVGQLKDEIGGVNRRINKVNKDLRAGIAGANAAAGLPQVYIPGKSMVAASAGTFKGESAVAVGYSRASDNGKLILKLQGNANTRGDLGGSVGVGYQW